MRNYCTLFNKKYLGRALALYESLLTHSPGFQLYIYCMDMETLNFFRTTPLKHATPVSLAEFEDNDLLAIKATRTTAEYCWTCTPSIILHSLHTFNLSECTYLDADLYFYNNPEILHNTMPEYKSIFITKHRYTEDCDQSLIYGIYCVQFITAKNTPAGLQVLEWWRARCIEWCFAQVEDNKFGDQKYLDDWMSRFHGIVHELPYPGDIGPWNTARNSYFLSATNELWLHDASTNLSFKVVFYHFHNLKFDPVQGYGNPKPFYSIPATAYQLLYKPYLNKITRLKTTYPAALEISEFPDAPISIHKSQFDSEIFPANTAEAELIKNAYRYKADTEAYHLRDGFKTDDLIFALLKTDYNLSSE